MLRHVMVRIGCQRWRWLTWVAEHERCMQGNRGVRREVKRQKRIPRVRARASFQPYECHEIQELQAPQDTSSTCNRQARPSLDQDRASVSFTSRFRGIEEQQVDFRRNFYEGKTEHALIWSMSLHMSFRIRSSHGASHQLSKAAQTSPTSPYRTSTIRTSRPHPSSGPPHPTVSAPRDHQSPSGRTTASNVPHLSQASSSAPAVRSPTRSYGQPRPACFPS